MHLTSSKNNLIIKLLIISSILFSFNVSAAISLCNTTEFDRYIGAKYIKSIDVTTPKSKKWAKNYFKALRDDREILKKYKKKFDANITVLFDNDLECNFLAKIRISGDAKDHLTSAPLVTSLNVTLLNGNINSIVKFKLFIPRTRNGDNEILSTALLKELGFLAPKTYYVSATFNGQAITYIFQEKISKEFIESNNLREAPILEGDERFIYDYDRVKGGRFALARIVNKNWAEKGATSLKISQVALAHLNKAYLDHLSGLRITKTTNKRFLRENALSHGNYIDKDSEFKAILVAMSASHGLVPNNRSFYYDPLYQRFEPIYYDGNASTSNVKTSLKDLLYFGNKLNNEEIIGSGFALKSFSNLDRKRLHSRLGALGLDYSLKDIGIILDKIISNLELINNVPLSQHTKNQYSPYFSNYVHLDKDTNQKKLVFSTKKVFQVEICDFSLVTCRYDHLNIKNYAKLLQGKYLDNSGNAYIYIGNKQEYITGENALENQKIREINIDKGVKLIAYGDPKISINKKDKIIEISQSNSDDRILLRNGQLKDWSINFTGSTIQTSNTEQRFNQNLLTGCLTLSDTQIDNVNIKIDSAFCEDGMNLVRTNGILSNVVINNALSDAIDADFSKLTFKNIIINSAGNDCIDVSAGDYHIKHADLSGCKDKAISVGEKSNLLLDSAQISQSKTGLAAKDSSTIVVNSVIAIKVAICFSAYNKKQEFYGGRITIGQHNCLPDQISQQEGSLIEFIQ